MLRYVVDTNQFKRPGEQRAFEIIVEVQYGIVLVEHMGQLSFDCNPDRISDIACAGLSVIQGDQFQIGDDMEGVMTTYPRTFRARRTGDDR